MNGFLALMLDEVDGKVTAAIRRPALADLPQGDVTVRVSHSTLNYKDGMILNGLGRLVRAYPHIPGIDFAGVVETSTSPDWKAGDAVILTGWRVGEVRWGGFAQMARVEGRWLVPLPQGLTPVRAMAIGTAGLTAMLAVMALENHGIDPKTEGEVLVTGAAGGLGSIAVALLARAGYRVAASTGRASQHEYLKSLGAVTIIDRAELAAPTKPLAAERWAGCIDAVGGTTLANVLASVRLHGAVAACGNAGGVELATTVLPFLLRGISLQGIDSAQCLTPRRLLAWNRLAKELPMDLLDSMTSSCRLADLPEKGAAILRGEIKGRLVVDVNA